MYELVMVMVVVMMKERKEDEGRRKIDDVLVFRLSLVGR